MVIRNFYSLFFKNQYNYKNIRLTKLFYVKDIS